MQMQRWLGVGLAGLLGLLLGVLPTGWAGASPGEGIRVAGYGTVLYDFSSPEQSFFLRRLILEPEGSLGPNLFFKVELEFENEPLELQQEVREEPGEVLGGVRVDEVELYQAMVEWSFSPGLALQVGQVLVPFSRINERHEDHLWPTPDRPLIGIAAVPTGWGEPGIKLVGEQDWEAWGGLRYQVGVSQGFNLRILEEKFYEGEFGLRLGRGDSAGDNNDDKALAGRMVWTSPGGVEIGVSGYQARYDSPLESYTQEDRLWIRGWGVEGLWTPGALRIEGEIVDWRIERDPRLQAAYARKYRAGERATTVPSHLQGIHVLLAQEVEWGRGWLERQGFRNPRLVIYCDWTRLVFRDLLPPTPDGKYPENISEALFTQDGKDLIWEVSLLGLSLEPRAGVQFNLAYQWTRNKGERQEVARQPLEDYDGVVLGMTLAW